MSYTYQSFVVALTGATQRQKPDPDFVLLIPTIIDSAEQRCYRDLDLLNTVVVDHSSTLTANQRSFTLPTTVSGPFVTVKEIAVFTGTYPAGRTILLPKPYEFIDYIFPSETGTGGVYPQYYAPVTDQTVIVAPASSTTLTVEVRGTIRPTTLSASNTTTFLSTYAPDVFFAAAMSATSAMLASTIAPQKVDWAQEYQARLGSLAIEELKRKFQFGDWTPARQ